MKQRIKARVVVIISVLLLHVAVLWVLQGGLLRRAAAPVVPITVVSELLLPAAQRPEAPEPGPAVKPSPQTPRMPIRTEPAQTATVAVPDPSPSPAPAATIAQPQAAAPAAASLPNSAVATTPPGPGSSTQAQKVELPSSDAAYLNNPAPAYPSISRRLGEEGRVVVRVLIGTDGVAQQARIQSSSGYERLDQTALTTTLKWRYLPGKRGGVPEAMWYDVPFNFRLSSSD